MDKDNATKIDFSHSANAWRLLLCCMKLFSRMSGQSNEPTKPSVRTVVHYTNISHALIGLKVVLNEI